MRIKKKTVTNLNYFKYSDEFTLYNFNKLYYLFIDYLNL